VSQNGLVTAFLSKTTEPVPQLGPTCPGSMKSYISVYSTYIDYCTGVVNAHADHTLWVVHLHGQLGIRWIFNWMISVRRMPLFSGRGRVRVIVQTSKPV
jgi:hypothetical protein